MIFYSEREPTDVPPFDLAETNGLPPFLLPIDSGGIAESGPEGTNSFTWAPGGPWDNIYNGVSDVPEPGTLPLLAFGAAAWLMARRRSKRTGSMKAIAVLLAVGLLALSIAGVTAQPFTVVDVIPSYQSGETDQNAEPSIAVNPGSPNQIVISSFRSVNVPQPYFTTTAPGAKWDNFAAQDIVHGDTTITWSPLRFYATTLSASGALMCGAPPRVAADVIDVRSSAAPQLGAPFGVD